MAWTDQMRKKRDPSISTNAQRKYVRGIAEALGIKLERKLMKTKYCEEFIKEHKQEYYNYLNVNNIIPPPTQKQKRLINKMYKVLEHHYDTDLLKFDYEFENVEQACDYIGEWYPKYRKIIREYYKERGEILTRKMEELERSNREIEAMEKLNRDFDYLFE